MENDKNRKKINLDALAYNLIRLYNLKQEKLKIQLEDLKDFYERTSIKNQLKLDITIF
ncbi:MULTISPECIES: hypothetical protein [Methanobrevibacter]|uniref:Uncharacterized protein n=1 Tax=Methanobrevibacter smithii (strain ATCC 35061 / DSM 861 / OCM 144 / PS) TaxID=420247 RepID=A5UJ49_METS3|nr:MULTISPECIES: hypothetical protein [Methanobrevibacter]ABQ86227.1 hypothetical protein Msm_0022 [Methanobrevibacter smithii ATCC 35061]